MTREYDLLIKDPRILFDMYMEKLMNGEQLSEEQLVKFEYLKSLFIIKKEETNGV